MKLSILAPTPIIIWLARILFYSLIPETDLDFESSASGGATRVVQLSEPLFVATPHDRLGHF